MLWPFTVPSSCHKTTTQQIQVRAQHKSMWGLSCPLTFRCSSLMLILLRCQQTKRYCMQGEKGKYGKVGLRNLRRWKRTESTLNESSKGELRNLKKGGRWWYNRLKTVTWIRMYGVNAHEERIQWRGYISKTSQANYPATVPFSISRPLFPISLSSSLTFSITALTIQVLSTATDP